VPELPEVEATARGLRPRIVGRQVVSVGNVDWPRMLPQTSQSALAGALLGHRVQCVDRRGKYVLIGFDHDVWLVVHRKMSGNLLLQATECPPPKHTHLELQLDDGTALRFVDPRKFGRVYLFHSTDERDDFLTERLGPDSLLELDAAMLAEKLRGRRGRIKPLLMNQAFVAGLGNLYADEALWLARIHPGRTADSLSRHETSRLAAAIREVLSAAIERRGTSFDTNYRDVDGELGENQGFLNVYGRANQACPRCGRSIRRIELAGRGTHFCPRCQRLK
jgi:formamidopyrimidine-DNA glycosylase